MNRSNWISLPDQEPARRERMMMSIKKVTVALFVDRLSNQWVVRDPDGDFWIVPFGESGWESPRAFGAEQIIAARIVSATLHIFPCPAVLAGRGGVVNAEQIR